MKLTAGQQVKLIALLSRMDLNGKVGAIVDGPNDKGRYTIDVCGEKLALKPDNLAPTESSAPSKDAAVDIA